MSYNSVMGGGNWDRLQEEGYILYKLPVHQRPRSWKNYVVVPHNCWQFHTIYICFAVKLSVAVVSEINYLFPLFTCRLEAILANSVM